MTEGPKSLALNNRTNHSPAADATAEYTVTAGEEVAAENGLILKFKADDRVKTGLMAITLFGK